VAKSKAVRPVLVLRPRPFKTASSRGQLARIWRASGAQPGSRAGGIGSVPPIDGSPHARAPVVRRRDGHGRDLKRATGAKNPQRDLTAVRYEELLDAHALRLVRARGKRDAPLTASEDLAPTLGGADVVALFGNRDARCADCLDRWERT